MIRFVFIVNAILLLFACKESKKADVVRDDLKKFYAQNNLAGSFVLYDTKHGNYTFINKEESTKPFTPASTFKICNSLIGLETGVIPDEYHVIKWDSINRPNPNWNKDQDMATAFRNSTFWYYQQLAKRVGEEKMKYWLDTANYGNADISGGIDQFWLRGNLRISHMQQIDFLRRLHDDELPFSKKHMATVKSIMKGDSTDAYMMRAKTGWGAQDGQEIGWFVGYVETKGNTYYFSNCIQTPSKSPTPLFPKARVDIVYHILEELKVIEPKDDGHKH